MLEKEIKKQVSKEFGIPEKTVEDVYTDWLKYIKKTIISYNYFEFDNQRTFTIPFLGTIYTYKVKIDYINKLRENGRAEYKKNPSKK